MQGGDKEVGYQAILGAPQSRDRSWEELRVGSHLAVRALLLFWVRRDLPLLLSFFVLSLGVPGLGSLAYFSEPKALTRTEGLAPDPPKQKCKVPGPGETLIPSEKRCL